GARFEGDDEKDVITDDAGPGEHLNGEEICSGDGAPLRLEKGVPGAACPSLGRRLDACIAENGLDGASSQLMAEVVESAADAGVTPGRIFGGHLQHQRRKLGLGGRAPSAAVSRAIVLSSN